MRTETELYHCDKDRLFFYNNPQFRKDQEARAFQQYLECSIALEIAPELERLQWCITHYHAPRFGRTGSTPQLPGRPPTSNFLAHQ